MITLIRVPFPMKILHIAGWSGSGKTTFILKLISHLQRLGKPGTIKHLGCHSSLLPTGKDTSLHFNSGASPTVGIDSEKTFVLSHDTDLESSLDLLSDTGVRFAIIEGFKKYPFKKILIGEMECQYLLKNPDFPEVISSLEMFDDWYTLSGLIRELSERFPGRPVLTWTGYCRDYPLTAGICASLESEMSKQQAVEGIRVRVHRWVQDTPYPVFLVLVPRDGVDAFPIFSEIVHHLTSCSDPGLVQNV